MAIDRQDWGQRWQSQFFLPGSPRHALLSASASLDTAQFGEVVRQSRMAIAAAQSHSISAPVKHLYDKQLLFRQHCLSTLPYLSTTAGIAKFKVFAGVFLRVYSKVRVD